MSLFIHNYWTTVYIRLLLRRKIGVDEYGLTLVCGESTMICGLFCQNMSDCFNEILLRGELVTLWVIRITFERSTLCLV